MQRRSAGLLPYRRGAGGTEVLIGHMGGPYWAKKDERAWSIVKGEVQEDEDDRTAALREFREETGAAAPAGAELDLGEVRQSGGKVVIAWAVEGPDLDPAALQSNSFELEWPPRSGKAMSFPELDRFAWCSVERAAALLVAAQVPLLERLAEQLAAGGR